MSKKLSDYNESRPKIIRNIIYSDLALSFQPFGSTIPGVSESEYIYEIRPVNDIDAVKNAIKNLILTNRGERPFHPELGANVTALLFEPADPFTVMSIKNEINRVIRAFEPRVDSLEVDVIDQSERNSYYITIRFSIQATGYESEVSFYLNRLR